jgi:hypothetical protein
MIYLLLAYSAESAWTREEWLACTVASGRICDELRAAGRFIAAAPLHPVASATSVRIRAGQRLVTDRPFAETRECLGGFYAIDVRDLNDAIAIAAQHPGAGVGTVEVRRLVDLAALAPS